MTRLKVPAVRGWVIAPDSSGQRGSVTPPEGGNQWHGVRRDRGVVGQQGSGEESEVVRVRLTQQVDHDHRARVVAAQLCQSRVGRRTFPVGRYRMSVG